jgi:hypothetical protein
VFVHELNKNSEVSKILLYTIIKIQCDEKGLLPRGIIEMLIGGQRHPFVRNFEVMSNHVV